MGLMLLFRCVEELRCRQQHELTRWCNRHFGVADVAAGIADRASRLPRLPVLRDDHTDLGVLDSASMRWSLSKSTNELPLVSNEIGKGIVRCLVPDLGDALQLEITLGGERCWRK